MQPIVMELFLTKPNQVSHSIAQGSVFTRILNPKFLIWLKSLPVCQIKMIGFHFRT